MIVIVFGLPGSGKSFLASRLALKLDAKYVNSDQVRLKLFKQRNYTDEEKELVYETLLAKARSAKKNKENLVIDATFYKQHLREPYLKELGDEVTFIEVKARKAIIKKRLSQPRAFSEADLKVHKKIKKEWEPFEEKHLILESTDDNIGELLGKAELHLHTHSDSR